MLTKRALSLVVPLLTRTPSNWRLVGGTLRGCLMTPLMIALMFALFATFVYAIDAVMYPWAYSLFSTPTLTGGWYGRLRATHGDRSKEFGLYVQILHDPWRRYRRTDFEGRVETCTATGVQTGGSISGRYNRWVLDRNAPFELDFFGSERRRHRPGESLGPLKAPYLGILDARLKGTWTGVTTTLSGSGSLAFVVRDGPIWATSSPATEPLTQVGTTLAATLRKGTEGDYLATCRGISGGRL